jgi:hypothetical protein
MPVKDASSDSVSAEPLRGHNARSSNHHRQLVSVPNPAKEHLPRTAPPLGNRAPKIASLDLSFPGFRFSTRTFATLGVV